MHTGYGDNVRYARAPHCHVRARIPIQLFPAADEQRFHKGRGVAREYALYFGAHTAADILSEAQPRGALRGYDFRRRLDARDKKNTV